MSNINNENFDIIPYADNNFILELLKNIKDDEEIRNTKINISETINKISWNDDNDIPNFGFFNIEYNYKFLYFLDPDYLSNLPLTPNQIDALSEILNWDTISSRFLPGWIFVKHQHRVNWEIFLKNPYPKDPVYLAQIKDTIKKYNHIFISVRFKNQYYTKEFMNYLPEFVDWKWCSKNSNLDEETILKYWKKFHTRLICKYQTITENIIHEKYEEIDWMHVCKKPLSLEVIIKYKNFVNWDIICKYQKLPESFIIDYKHILLFGKIRKYLISRYQTLSEKFICNYENFLDWNAISKFQLLSYNLIIKFVKKINMESLYKNKKINKKGEVNIFYKNNEWWIIDSSDINLYNDLHFCVENVYLDKLSIE